MLVMGVMVFGSDVPAPTQAAELRCVSTASLQADWTLVKVTMPTSKINKTSHKIN